MPQKNWDFVRVTVVENWGDFRIVWLDLFYFAGFTMQFAQICNIFPFAVHAVDEDGGCIVRELILCQARTNPENQLPRQCFSSSPNLRFRSFNER